MHYNWKNLGKAVLCFLINKERISSLLLLFTTVSTLFGSKVGFFFSCCRSLSDFDLEFDASFQMCLRPGSQQSAGIKPLGLAADHLLTHTSFLHPLL